MLFRRKKEPSDLRKLFNYENKSFLGGKEKPNNMTVPENIECLSRYYPANKIPNLTMFRIMRVPVFFISLIFFTLMSWGSIDDKASITNLLKLIDIHDRYISISYNIIPKLSISLALGIFVAIMYNLSIYRRIFRHLIKNYRHDYVVNMVNAIDSCSWDKSEQSLAIYARKDNTPSAIFLVVEEDGIIPTLVNSGALTEETDLVKAYVKYKPLDSGSSYLFPLINDYGKPVSYVSISRSGDLINIHEEGDDNFNESVIYDKITKKLTSVTSSEQKNVLP